MWRVCRGLGGICLPDTLSGWPPRRDPRISAPLGLPPSRPHLGPLLGPPSGPMGWCSGGLSSYHHGDTPLYDGRSIGAPSGRAIPDGSEGTPKGSPKGAPKGGILGVPSWGSGPGSQDLEVFTSFSSEGSSSATLCSTYPRWDPIWDPILDHLLTR